MCHFWNREGRVWEGGGVQIGWFGCFLGSRWIARGFEAGVGGQLSGPVWWVCMEVGLLVGGWVEMGWVSAGK